VSACTTLVATKQRQQWSTQWIAPLPFGLSRLVNRRDGWPIGAAGLHAGEAVICVPNVVSENERERLLAVSTALAAGAQSTRRDAGPEALPDGVLADEHSVRLHVPKTLAASDVALCDDLLIRMLRFVDAQLPCLGSYLFASPALCDLHAECALEFSANEPAINVRPLVQSCPAHVDSRAWLYLTDQRRDQRES
jgi:hypothetical protein